MKTLTTSKGLVKFREKMGELEKSLIELHRQVGEAADRGAKLYTTMRHLIWLDKRHY